MTTTTRVSQAVSSSLVVAPAVTSTGDTLTIAAATCILKKVEVALPETTYTTTSRADKTLVMIYVARTIATDTWGYFVDEIVDDGVDLHYVFEGSPYEPLFQVVQITVPATTTAIASCDVILFKTTPIVVPTPPIPSVTLPQQQQPPN